MKKYILYILFIPALLLGSCNKWLEIDPDDRIMENNLFSDREGFMVALNGVYIEMSSTTLYGGWMQVGLFDVLAQYYTEAMGYNTHSFSNYKDFQYEQEGVKKTYQEIWEKYYNLIINCNSIIEHCDKSKDILGEKYYSLIKGEALALRAFFHFEVLRIWGPIFKENPEGLSIPYAESSKIEVRPLLTGNTVYEKILKDLQDAETLMKEQDPIITEGVLFTPGGFGERNDMRYRNLRLNYFAVQALIARAALYCNDRATALDYAKRVVTAVQKEKDAIFPFIVRGQDEQDRVYKTELIFAQYNLKRSDLWKNYFSNSLSDANVLRVSDATVDDMYEETDYRYKTQWKKAKSPQEVEQYYFTKYKDVTLSDPDSEKEKQQKEYRYLVPMIRISEMYYIIAECESDQTLALEAINKVRNARALKNLTDYSLLANELEKEYKREFIGEGQLFFYYKRLAQKEIVYGQGSWGPLTVTMNTEKYIPELPDSEKNNRIE